MTKKATLSLLFLGCLCLGAISCGGSGNTESSDINPGENLSFFMGGARGTIKIVAATPSSGIVYYLSVPIYEGTTKNDLSSDGAVNFYYRPSTGKFSITFQTGNNWHIDAGPVVRDFVMVCDFEATIAAPSLENGQTKNGSMDYSFNRRSSGLDPVGHIPFADLNINVTGQTGTYSRSSTAE